jgi:hypothetical protein
MAKSKAFELTYYLRLIIRAMFKRDGRNFRICELCGGPIPFGRFQLHHTKYDGATYYDLRIVCRKCNNAPLNRNLD